MNITAKRDVRVNWLSSWGEKKKKEYTRSLSPCFFFFFSNPFIARISERLWWIFYGMPMPLIAAKSMHSLFFKTFHFRRGLT